MEKKQMFSRKSLTDLAVELERQAKAKLDYKAPTSLMEFDLASPPAKPDLLTVELPLRFRVADKGSFAPTELMHDQLGRWAGIPSIYYDRLKVGTNGDRTLLASNVNHWLKQQKETRLIRTLDGKARAFLSNRYRTIDNFDVANAALPILVQESKKLGNIDIASCDVTETRLYVKVTSKRLTYEVKKGDVVQAGIVISNSEVGKGSVRIEPFLLRLVCENGAIIEDNAIRKFHLGRQSAELEAAEQVFQDATRKADDHAFVLKLQDVVRAAFDQGNFDKLRGITVDATTRKIKAPIQDVVEEVVSRFNLSERYADSFLKNLIEGGDTSQWGLANAVTAAANTAESYEKATELERIGGSIMTLDGHAWRDLADAAA